MTKEVLLIHGWDPRFYNRNLGENVPDEIAWSYRSELINLLSRDYKLRYFNLPGFCGVPEPEKKQYNIGDFTDRLAESIKSNAQKPQLIIGYSFGGVVALDYKNRYDDSIPAVLISPAIVRKETLRSKMAHVIKNGVSDGVSDVLKRHYQYIFSRYYRSGTSFLRNSYDLIVRQNTLSLLEKIDPMQLLLVYGDSDVSTPWTMVERKVKDFGINYHLIPGGTHNIGKTHPEEIVKLINNFLKSR